MKRIAVVLGVVLLLGIVVYSTFSSGYNTMVQLQETVNSQWGQVKNVYQRRADLIPNLVNTAKGYADFEKSTLIAVTEARAKAGQVTVSNDVVNDPEKLKQFEQAQNQVSGALSRLLVISENYPQLRANENFQTLMVELEGTENRISVERMKFNDKAREYNTYIRSFPHNILANMSNFHAVPYFEGTAGNEKAPEVKF